MKCSIITISYNQLAYLKATVRSVLDQGYPDLEYIVVDPGSTDGSREYLQGLPLGSATLVFEPDTGPADGLNKGFARATGEMLGFLNSDDVLLPGALHNAAAFLQSRPDVDVVSGHALIIDDKGTTLRKSFSQPFDLRRYAYGVCVVNQPSTFFRRSAFERSGGFNAANRCAWDGELWVDMAMAGARFAVQEEFWSGYRITAESITGSGKLNNALQKYQDAIFEKIIGRPSGALDRWLSRYYRLERLLANPRFLIERLARGPINGRFGK